MLESGEEIICSLEKMSAPSKSNITQEEIEWLSGECTEIKNIFAFSFDRIKEIQYGSEKTSCDTFVYTTEKSKNLNYLIEFKRTDLKELKKYCVNDKSSSKYKDSINRKIEESAFVLSNSKFQDTRDGTKMVESTHVVVVYAEDSKMPTYMKKTKKSGYRKKISQKSTVMSNIPDMAFMLNSSVSPKEYVKQNIGGSARDSRFSSKKEKNNLVQSLGTTARKSKYSQNQNSKAGYVTLLNKKEFIKLVRKKIEEGVYYQWDWGEFSKYFNELNRNIMNQEKYNERLKIGLEQGLEHGIEGKIELLYNDLHLTIPEIAQKLKVSEEYVQRVVDGIEGKD